jgi:hypothetical protein
VDDPTLDEPVGSVVDGSAGAVHRLLPLSDDRVFAFGDVFTDATFEATSVTAPASPNLFSWRLSDALSRRQLVVAGDSWAKPLARQRFVEIGDVTGLGAGGFALTGTYPVTSFTPPLALGGACAPLDRDKEFSFVAVFDVSGACQWVRTVETYDPTDAGPGGATGITFQNGVVELPSGEIVTAMTARSASFTFGDDESGVEQIVSPAGLDHWGLMGTYTADGALVRVATIRPFSQGNGEQVSLNAIGRSNAGGYAVAGSAEAAVQINTGGGALSTPIDPNVATDGFFANIDQNGNPTFLSFAGSIDTDATMAPVAITLAGSDLVAVGYANGDVFPLSNLLAMDSTSVWVARLSTGNGSILSTSAITGVWGDDLVLAANEGGTRYVVATNSGYDDQVTVQIEDPAGSVAFSEPGTLEPLTVVAFYNAATGAPVAHEVVRGAAADATVAVRGLSFTSDTEMWISGYALNSVSFVNSFGTTITYPSMNTEMAFALRFTDAGGDDWSGGLGARSFVGNVTSDGATALDDGSLLMWGQVYDDARFIGWQWFQPGTGTPGFDYLWFVPLDVDE